MKIAGGACRRAQGNHVFRFNRTGKQTAGVSDNNTCKDVQRPPHGNNMANTWQTHGNHMATTWQQHGKCMATYWQVHGNNMANTWQHLCTHISRFAKVMAPLFRISSCALSGNRFVLPTPGPMDPLICSAASCDFTVILLERGGGCS